MKKQILGLFVVVAMLGVGQHVHGLNQSKEKINQRNVVAFYNCAINEKDFNKASKYLGKRYIQHNPNAADGREGLKSYIAYLKTKYPNSHSEIKRVFTDGDHVILHVHAVRTPGERGRAIVDIFRLENQKIIEHWDVIQDIPETSANQNGLF